MAESSPPAAPEESPDLVLIHPPAVSRRYLATRFLPHGPAVLSAFLREHGLAVALLDLLPDYLDDNDPAVDFHDPGRTFTEDQFRDHLRGNRSSERLARFTERYGRAIPAGANIHAFSIVSYHQFWAALLLAGFLKRERPGSTIVFGGPFVTLKPREFLVAHGGADYWVKGSGERPLLELARRLRHRARPDDPAMAGVIAAAAPDASGSSARPFAAAAERLPDFTGLDLDRYRYDHPRTGPGSLFVPYRTSKGCPSACAFCTGRLVDRYDRKPVNRIANDLAALVDRYHTKNFMFTDASINGDPRMLAALCRRIGTELPGLNWYAYARVKGLTAALMDLMRQAGCFGLFWGVESVHSPTAAYLGKGFRVETVRPLVDAAIDLGLESHLHLLYNTPFETPADIAAITSLVERYVDHPLVEFLPHRFLLEPGSAMFMDPAGHGLAGLVKTPVSRFEREQYKFAEINGPDHQGVEARNQRHREMLAGPLARIEARQREREAAGRFRDLM
jgi:hypothetical protein